ncbi:MAG: DUF937 domain-containing protein [Bryobacterales bacterium]|nr:DUF937 domain-containing protein [Bryobacterales bacterium]
MNLLETLLSAQGGGAVRNLANQFGLDESQAASAISSLLPALQGGLQNNLSQAGGIDGLLGALQGGNHARFLDDESAFGAPETTAEGNGILGHLLGSKDASRAAANAASEQTGLPAQMMKQMLPVVATMVMGALSKQNAAAPQAEGGLMGTLSSLLDSNRDGNVADDVLGMAARFFQK